MKTKYFILHILQIMLFAITINGALPEVPVSQFKNMKLFDIRRELELSQDPHILEEILRRIKEYMEGYDRTDWKYSALPRNQVERIFNFLAEINRLVIKPEELAAHEHSLQETNRILTSWQDPDWGSPEWAVRERLRRGLTP